MSLDSILENPNYFKVSFFNNHFEVWIFMFIEFFQTKIELSLLVRRFEKFTFFGAIKN